MNESRTENSQNQRTGSPPQGGEGLLWRAWPCPSCRKRIKPHSDLARSTIPDSGLLPGIREEIAQKQALALVSWCETCSHTSWEPFLETEIARGSEHAVFFDEGKSQVLKITLPQIYGDFYYLKRGLVQQEKCLPMEYLARLHLWKKLFRCAPVSIGVTKDGRILSKQPFIMGMPPSQVEVDRFLEESGLIAVKKNRFIWKSPKFDEMEIGIGDTRDENFVKTESGIVPIDIRLWIM